MTSNLLVVALKDVTKGSQVTQRQFSCYAQGIAYATKHVFASRVAEKVDSDAALGSVLLFVKTLSCGPGRRLHC